MMSSSARTTRFIIFLSQIKMQNIKMKVDGVLASCQDALTQLESAGQRRAFLDSLRKRVTKRFVIPAGNDEIEVIDLTEVDDDDATDLAESYQVCEGK